jgi:phosphoribosylformylglycinamidine cyclo-ligase
MSSYKESGVNIDEADRFVEVIKSKTCTGIGGFGALFDIAIAKNYTHPILVSSTDGVGTKLEIARELGIYNTIGIDLVAMVVNDILVQGARPLYFLDYYATGKLDTTVASLILDGILEGCAQAGCDLIGGETAEMPGVYDSNKFDLAGFGVGIVDKHLMLPKSDEMKKGDLIIGWPSTGIHSNGFSLVRKIWADNKLPYTEELLTPTKIYLTECSVMAYKVKGFAHITGGGLLENIPRILPKHLDIEIFGDLQFTPIFTKIQELGNISRQEMMRTFNCGIGMVAIIAPEDFDLVSGCLNTLYVEPENKITTKIIGVLKEKYDTPFNSSGRI